MKSQELENFDPFLSEDMVLHFPQRTLVVLCGPSGCGKRSFSSRNFPQTYIVSSDYCRALISDNSRNQEINNETFNLAHCITRLRLKLARPTIFDSTALQSFARKHLLSIAQEYSYKTLLLAFDTPQALCVTRDGSRTSPPGRAGFLFRRKCR